MLQGRGYIPYNLIIYLVNSIVIVSRKIVKEKEDRSKIILPSNY